MVMCSSMTIGDTMLQSQERSLFIYSVFIFTCYRYGLIIVGNCHALRAYDAWDPYIDYFRNNQLIVVDNALKELYQSIG